MAFQLGREGLDRRWRRWTRGKHGGKPRSGAAGAAGGPDARSQLCLRLGLQLPEGTGPGAWLSLRETLKCPSSSRVERALQQQGLPGASGSAISA